MKYLTSIKLNPSNFMRNLPKLSLSQISPAFLVINSIFELCTLILFFCFDMLQFNAFIIWLIFVSLMLVITLLIYCFLYKKHENLYPFHNILLVFLLIYLFANGEDDITNNRGIQYFIGFLSAFFQILILEKSTLISGVIAILVSNLLYFFYFLKESQQAIVIIYYYVMFLYMIFTKIHIEAEKTTETICSKEHISEAGEGEISDNMNDLWQKVMNNIVPGNFFLLSFERDKVFQGPRISFPEMKNLNDTNFHDLSPMKSFEIHSNLIYYNEGCKEYNLDRKSDFIQLLDAIEISYVYKKENLLDYNNNLNHSNDEKSSDLIHEENNKRNLLHLIKNRLENFHNNLLLKSNNIDTIILNGFLTFKKIIKKPIKLHLTTFEQNSQTFLYFHISDLVSDENLSNLKEISKFKDQMLANVAHDLRSPISGIIAFINQSLEANITRLEREKLLDYAKVSANLLLHLIGDILDFSQIKKGVLNLVIKKFSLHELLDQIFNMMKYQAEIKNLKLYLDYEIGSDVIMETDDRRLCQLLINLLGNAIKFTVHGFVCLKVSKTQYSNILKFEVKDTGIGIKPEIKPHLFQPFATFSDKILNNKYGIGLGLSICKMMVSLLGPCNQLYVSSEYGKGAKFGFLLFTKIRKVDNSSLKLNINKMIWDKNEFKINRKKLNMDILSQIPKSHAVAGEIIEEDYLLDSWKIPNIRGSDNVEKDSAENEKELEINDKINISPYFSENNDFSMTYSEEKHDNWNEEHIIHHDNQLNKFQLKPKNGVNDCLNEKKGKICDAYENVELTEGEMLNEGRKMKKVFSVNSLNESKIRISEKSTLNILIADDNPFNIFILKNYLKKMTNLNFNVYSAVNGSQACEIFEEHNRTIENSEQFENVRNYEKTRNFEDVNEKMRKHEFVKIHENNSHKKIEMMKIPEKTSSFDMQNIVYSNKILENIEKTDKSTEIHTSSKDGNKPIHLIFMDCQMPILNGYEATKRIKEKINKYNYYKALIIAITAYCNENNCMECGMDAYLLKPVSEKDFIEIFELFLCQ